MEDCGILIQRKTAGAPHGHGHTLEPSARARETADAHIVYKHIFFIRSDEHDMEAGAGQRLTLSMKDAHIEGRMDCGDVNDSQIALPCGPNRVSVKLHAEPAGPFDEINDSPQSGINRPPAAHVCLPLA